MKKLSLDIIRAALFLFSIYSLFLEIRLLNQGEFTHSQIVDLKCDIPFFKTFCLPEINFTTINNQKITYKLNISQTLLFKGEEVGKRVDIIYDASDPHRVVINNFWDKWLNLIMAVVTGALAFFPSKWFKLLDLF